MRKTIEKLLKNFDSENVLLISESESQINDNILDKEYSMVIIDGINSLSEEKINKILKKSESVWIIFSLDDLIRRADSAVEEITEHGFPDITKIYEKFSSLFRVGKRKGSLIRLSPSEVALVVSKSKRYKYPNSKEFSVFLLSLSMIQYLKSRLEEITWQREHLRNELESKSSRIEQLEEEIRRLSDEKKRIERDFDKFRTQKERELQEERKRFRKEVVRLLKERERLQLVLAQKEKELRRREDELRKLEEEFRSREQGLIQLFEEEKNAMQTNFEKEIVNIRSEFEKLIKQKEIELKETRKRFRKEVVRLLKERERLELALKQKEDELNDIRKRMDEMQKQMEIEKAKIEKRYKDELKLLVAEMGILLEQKEKELKRNS